MSDSVQPHRQQPTRLPRPWDSPGKNTGIGCHFLLQYMKVKNESEVSQSCLTLSDPMDCSLPDSSIHGIFQARVLEWGAIAFSDCHARKPWIALLLCLFQKPSVAHLRLHEVQENFYFFSLFLTQTNLLCIHLLFLFNIYSHQVSSSLF